MGTCFSPGLVTGASWGAQGHRVPHCSLGKPSCWLQLLIGSVSCCQCAPPLLSGGVPLPTLRNQSPSAPSTVASNHSPSGRPCCQVHSHPSPHDSTCAHIWHSPSHSLNQCSVSLGRLPPRLLLLSPQCLLACPGARSLGLCSFLSFLTQGALPSVGC